MAKQVRLKKILIDYKYLKQYEAGGQRPPRRMRLVKKCLRSWTDDGWKSGKWFSESWEKLNPYGYASAWLPAGPYNRGHNKRIGRRRRGETYHQWLTRTIPD